MLLKKDTPAENKKGDVIKTACIIKLTLAVRKWSRLTLIEKKEALCEKETAVRGIRINVILDD